MEDKRERKKDSRKANKNGIKEPFSNKYGTPHTIDG